METYLSRQEPWLRDWKIAINNMKSTIVLFVNAMMHTQKSRPVQFPGDPIQRVKTARHIEVTPEMQLP
jgi:hypothetical protein